MQNNGGINLIDWTGIPNNWKLGKLGEYCEIRRGASPRPAGDPRYFGGDIPWFKIGDATKNPGRFLTETEETVNEEGARRSVQIPAGSLIIANSGVSLGFAVFVGVTGCVHDGWLVLNNFNGIDDRYIFYCVNLLTNALRGMADGTTQPNLNTTIARNLVIPVPPIDEQRRIAETLWSLDDKIELNRRMNATLEAMARALFKTWFVDFEPVHANKEIRPSTSASAEIAKLFPSEFENGIPKDWHLGKLGDVLEAKGGTTPSTKNSRFWEGENYWATPKDLSNLRFPVLLKTDRRITDEGVRQISSGVLPEGTLLLSSRAPIGYLAISQVPISINQGFIAIQGNEVSNLFMLYWLMENMESVKSRANGSTFQEISKSSFREVEITVPPESIREKFDTFVKPTFEKIIANEIESQNLAEIRDSLLPRLISGSIRASRTELKRTTL